MNSIWETQTKIRAFDVDSNDRLKINSILDYFQDAASNDAERLGFGYKDFVPLGLFWVLSWIKIEFVNFPKFMEEIRIQTWAKKQFKLYSMRDYQLLELSGKIICKATSAWILLDSKSLRPKYFTQLYPEFKMNDSINALTDLPEKINFAKQSEFVYSTQVRYSDIDLNKHTNNAKYIELMLDCFDEKFHSEHRIKSLIVSFNSESKFGDQIKLYKGTEKSDPLFHYVEAINQETGKNIFQAKVGWD